MMKFENAEKKKCSCVICNPEKESCKSLDSERKEIEAWRRYFLEDVFSRWLKNIPESRKDLLRSYFMAIPIGVISDPLSEVFTCLGYIIQNEKSKE